MEPHATPVVISGAGDETLAARSRQSLELDFDLEGALVATPDAQVQDIADVAAGEDFEEVARAFDSSSVNADDDIARDNLTILRACRRTPAGFLSCLEGEPPALSTAPSLIPGGHHSAGQ